ncbi:MAG: rhodanese-like domain-containing protein [Lachnospiraceae bacterium]|nr:rhodanese-like domain-containing protein [Lachnospiraceae bacterium]
MRLFHKTLTVNECINRSRTEQNAVLVDVRPHDLYRAGYIAGSINVPLEKPELLLGRVPDKETTVYVIGSVYHQPKKGVKAFRKLGYRHCVTGGIMEDHHGLLKHA